MNAGQQRRGNAWEAEERDVVNQGPACTDCAGTGLTGEQVYERLSNEGGIYLDVLCPTCQEVEPGEAVLSRSEPA